MSIRTSLIGLSTFGLVVSAGFAGCVGEEPADPDDARLADDGLIAVESHEPGMDAKALSRLRNEDAFQAPRRLGAAPALPLDEVGAGAPSASAVGDDQAVADPVNAPAMPRAGCGIIGSATFCSSPSCLCTDGEGDCDSDAECEPEHQCAVDVGAKYGFGALADVCVAVDICSKTIPGRADFCSTSCPCTAGEGDCDSDAECVVGHQCAVDVGAKYGFGPLADVCEAVDDCSKTIVGRPDFCSSSCPCAVDEGDCDGDSECAANLVCRHDIGAYYRMPPLVDMCQNPLVTCVNDGDCAGEWWCLGTSCVYGNTIAIDGTRDFDAQYEELRTLTTGFYADVAWDETNLYVALTGSDVGGNDGNKYVLIYLDGVASAYSSIGRAFALQEPKLAFEAGYLLAWKADNSSTRVYTYSGTAWTSAGWDLTGDIYQSGSYVEFRIPLGAVDGINLGPLPAHVKLHVSMINTQAGGEWTWAACPADSFPESAPGSGGAYDPDYGKYYSFEIGGTAVPVLYSSQ